MTQNITIKTPWHKHCKPGHKGAKRRALKHITLHCLNTTTKLFKMDGGETRGMSEPEGITLLWTYNLSNVHEPVIWRREEREGEWHRQVQNSLGLLTRSGNTVPYTTDKFESLCEECNEKWESCIHEVKWEGKGRDRTSTTNFRGWEMEGMINLYGEGVGTATRWKWSQFFQGLEEGVTNWSERGRERCTCDPNFSWEIRDVRLMWEGKGKENNDHKLLRKGKDVRLCGKEMEKMKQWP